MPTTPLNVRGGTVRLESNRAVMDQAHIDAGWFLRFPNGSVYDDVMGPVRPDPARPDQPNTTFSQYFIDWRNRDAAAYFVAAIVTATFLPGVDGTSLSGSISITSTVLSWICAGIHMCGALPSPVCA